MAGIFYPEQPKRLAELVDELLVSQESLQHGIAVIVPHGGYHSSGGVAGELYASLKWPSCAVVLSPGHTGLGKPFSLMSHGLWQTPLGTLSIHSELAKEILATEPLIHNDPLAHGDEHAIEVQLPFLQRCKSIKGFVPLIIGMAELPLLRRIGQGIAQAIRRTGVDTLLIDSTNLTRYESQEEVSRRDTQFLKQILTLDEEGLSRIDGDPPTSPCGIGSTIVTLVAAKFLGASRATLVKYQTSGDVSGEYTSVVGYAGLLMQ